MRHQKVLNLDELKTLSARCENIKRIVFQSDFSQEKQTMLEKDKIFSMNSLTDIIEKYSQHLPHSTFYLNIKKGDEQLEVNIIPTSGAS